MAHVLITGGARRIGAAMARRFAAAGHDLAIHCHSSQDEAEALGAELRGRGVRAQVFTADLGAPDQISAMFDAARRALGPVDLCINNASRFVNDDIHGIDPAVFDAHLAVNLKAPVQLADLVSRQPEPAPDRLVINLLDNKVFALNPDFFTYTLSKAALQAATEMLAQRFAGRPRVCAIAPGNTLISGDQSAENFGRASRINPLGRRVRPEDIAEAAAFLWQAKGCNNQVMVVDGGQVLWRLPRDVAFLDAESLHGA